jgi:RimJ/RimL family protein N-acetyltransferase/acyl carrier protein
VSNRQSPRRSTGESDDPHRAAGSGSSGELLTDVAFVSFVTSVMEQELNFSPAPQVTFTSHLIEDLGVDSLGMIVVLSAASDLLPDSYVPDLDAIAQIRSVGDLYDYYVDRATSPAPEVGVTAPGAYPAIRLRPIRSSDYPDLYAIVTSDEIAWRWRYDAGVPSYADFVESLSTPSALVQFAVTPIDDSRLLGTALCYNADWVNRIAYVAVAVAADYVGTGVGIEAIGLMIEYLFDRFDFQKLYAESIAPNYATFQNWAGSLFNVEATLRNHQIAKDALVDTYIIGIYPEVFRQRAGCRRRAASAGTDKLNIPRSDHDSASSAGPHEAWAS